MDKPSREAVAGAMDAAVKWVRECRSLCVLTGAGVSAESGVPTFRGPEGLWKRRDPVSLATPEAFAEDPKEVWEWYQWRRRKIRGCAPNAGHRALAAVEAVKPDFLLVTQNVDGLHRAAGSRRLAEIHGNIWTVRCVGCGAERYERGDFTDLPPRCGACGGLLRPGVVWFGEMPFAMERIDAALDRCALFLSIGTSGAVYPAAGFVQQVRHRGRAHTAELNMQPSEGATLFAEAHYGPATQVVPAYVEKILGPGW